MISMGRTFPSFTQALIEEEREWKPFRKYLDKSERKQFDDMIATPRLYISSCMYSANPIIIHPIFMSIIFHHHKLLATLVERVEKLADEHYDSIPR